jgi:hypothetical protein
MADCDRAATEPASGGGFREERYPLSYRQASLWFLEQWEPGTPAYLIPLVLRIRGDLDAGRAREALRILVARHEALRLCFDETVDGACQRVGDPSSQTCRSRVS